MTQNRFFFFISLLISYIVRVPENNYEPFPMKRASVKSVYTGQSAHFVQAYMNGNVLLPANFLHAKRPVDNFLLDWTKFKPFAKARFDVVIIFLSMKGKKTLWEKKKMLPAFSPFPTMFSKGSFHIDCVVKDYGFLWIHNYVQFCFEECVMEIDYIPLCQNKPRT